MEFFNQTKWEYCWNNMHPYQPNTLQRGITPTWKIKVCLTLCPPAATKSIKLFLASRSKSRSQGNLPWCHLHAKYEVSISYGSKVKAKVKVDNRQTNKQTERTKTICPHHLIWGHKKQSGQKLIFIGITSIPNHIPNFILLSQRSEKNLEK